MTCRVPSCPNSGKHTARAYIEGEEFTFQLCSKHYEEHRVVRSAELPSELAHRIVAGDAFADSDAVLVSQAYLALLERKTA